MDDIASELYIANTTVFIIIKKYWEPANINVCGNSFGSPKIVS